MKNEREEFKRFILKLFVFALPLIIYCGFTFWVLSISGEITPIDAIIREQCGQKNPVLVGLVYSDTNFYYKLGSLLKRKPEIVVLGTSRSNQFRSRFFNLTKNSYNASGVFSRVGHLPFFLRHLPVDKQPKVFIVGLDHIFFNPQAQVYDDNIRKRYSKLFQWACVFSNIPRVGEDYIYRKKFLIRELYAPRDGAKKFGMNSIINNNGYRNDGSYLHGAFLKDPWKNIDYRCDLRETMMVMEKGIYGFDFAKNIPPEALESLDLFLSECMRRGIHVIGFLPFYPHAVFEKMKSMGNKYEYLFKLEETLRPMFDKYNFGFYDFSDMAWVGSSDKERIDGSHGSEKTCLRAYLIMLEKEKVLQKYSEPEYLKARLNASKSDFTVFGDDEF